jgi:hypothetical protein
MVQRVCKRFRTGLFARLSVMSGLLAGMAVITALAGCGSGLRVSDSARADVDAATPGCAATVLDALGQVASRVYAEGVVSERTAAAAHLIGASAPLRDAVERGDAKAARAAARALIATGHMTNLQVTRGSQILVEAGGGGALAPVRGTIAGAHGAPIANFVTSVWANDGLIAETDGIAEGLTVLRSGQRTITGAVNLPPGPLPAQGTLTLKNVGYQYTSFPASAYPAGNPIRVYLLRSISSTTPLCGTSSEETTVNTISHIARLIYEGEVGHRTIAQIRRVQQNQPLLEAVARRDPAATRRAVEKLLHQHIVRLRVSAGTHLLSDVGGPFVLAPVHAPLHLGGRQIGSFLLSIQDDEGYKRLAKRLAGLDVLMYMGKRLVKSTVGPSPGAIPTSGTVQLHGSTFRAFTFTAKAFPSGPLRITVLIPIPYT